MVGYCYIMIHCTRAQIAYGSCVCINNDSRKQISADELSMECAKSMSWQGLTGNLLERELADSAGPSFRLSWAWVKLVFDLTVVPSPNGHRTTFVSKRGPSLLGLGQTHLLGPNAPL